MNQEESDNKICDLVVMAKQEGVDIGEMLQIAFHRGWKSGIENGKELALEALQNLNTK